MKPGDVVLEARDVYKIYELGDSKVYALHGVSTQIKRGEFVSIMGPSGSGKTTFLDVLSCMARPTKGDVLIKGKKISVMDDDELARKRGSTIGFVFQTFNLVPRLNAVENVMLPLWFKGVPPAERRQKAIEALKAVGLGNRLWHKPGQLSGGQRQRVAIARALAVEPEIIVADEPTGNLDSVSGTQILDLIADLHREQGKTILMVTHEKTVGARAEKIVRLMDGKIVGTENGSGGKK